MEIHELNRMLRRIKGMTVLPQPEGMIFKLADGRVAECIKSPIRGRDLCLWRLEELMSGISTIAVLSLEPGIGDLYTMTYWAQ